MLFIEEPIKALVRAINKNNELNPPLKVEDISLDNPDIWIQGQTNTRVTITMVNEDDYTGSVVYYYNRIRIYDYFGGWVVPGRAADYSTTLEALTAMYDKYHLPLDPDDIVSQSVSPQDTGLILQGRNTSLMFVPSLTVTLPFEES